MQGAEATSLDSQVTFIMAIINHIHALLVTAGGLGTVDSYVGGVICVHWTDVHLELFLVVSQGFKRISTALDTCTMMMTPTN